MNKMKQPAYSLIFAFVMMTGIMLVAAATIEDTQSKVRFFNDLEGSSKARLAAESSVDLALRDLRGYDAGYESSDPESFCEYADPGNQTGPCQTSGEYEIFSQGEEATDGRFYIPIPNTGNAAPLDECDITDNTVHPTGHSCNWNKLLVGQTVNIPLYTSDATGEIVPPSEILNFSDWELSVRTPCTDGNLEDDCGDGQGGVERFLLDGDDSVYETDDTIILWTLTGFVNDGTPEGDLVSLVPNDAVEAPFFSTIRKLADNTEIYESLINDPTINLGDLSGYVVLKAEDLGNEFQPLYDLSIGDVGAIGAGDLEQLALQLTIVNPLVEQSTGDSVPYLEWQLSSSGPAPFADNKTVILGEGYYEGQTGTFYFSHVIEQSSIDESATIYTLGN